MTSIASQATKGMAKLSLDPISSTSSKPKPKPKKKALVDSWEDEESSASEAEAETEPPTPSAQLDSTKQDGVAAPPPTPLSPSYGRHGPNGSIGTNAPWAAGSSTGGAYSGREDAQNEGGMRRPEKTDAVARRMIASALGVRAPKQTEEQKAYDRSVREKERKRREEEREAERKRKEEAEKAKAAMWDD
ncbi:hypothetical protein GGS24DRAFT_497963 [Hypoxylon argillaceum]|nr:hypothetical protein GGS24DRAFT_497963 [Hypoxylon argillaceum]KAI1155162.1 hypothetical protein F4825DRAFT_408329 [Nemania diffusa]